MGPLGTGSHGREELRPSPLAWIQVWMEGLRSALEGKTLFKPLYYFS